MTPNEIKKALECCTTTTCNDCPYQAENFDNRCYRFLINDVCDLINSQQAKIKALEMDNEQLQSDIINSAMNLEHAQAEIERLQHSPIIAELCPMWKAEAIRDFAERVKGKAFVFESGFEANEDKVIKFVSVSEIDNLVKEMVGEKQ